MKRSFASALTAALVTALVVVLSDDVSPAAQSGDSASAPLSAKPIPRMPDGRPDFTGVWWPGHDLIPAQATAVYREGQRAGVGPNSFGSLYKPEFKAKAAALSDKDDPALLCIPSIFGPTPLVGNGLVGEIVQTPRAMIQLVETYHGFRIIPTDGRPHRDDVVRRTVATPLAVGKAIRWSSTSPPSAIETGFTTTVTSRFTPTRCTWWNGIACSTRTRSRST